MNTTKKVILGIIIAIIGYFVIAFIVAHTWHAIDPEGQRQYFDELETKREAEEIQKQVEQEKQIQNQKIKEDLAATKEKRYENMVLNYKGKDGKGFSIKDFSDARCSDNQQSFAQYLGDNFDGRTNYHHVMVHSPVNIDWNPPCLGAGWHFGVNEMGDVIAWDYSAERQDILDYLDNQN